jgi:hypothetical protein
MSEQPPAELSLESQMLLGYHVVILHLFSCLNAKDILPFSEAIQSLKETIEDMEKLPRFSVSSVQAVVQALEKLALRGDIPDPSKPPPPTRLH